MGAEPVSGRRGTVSSLTPPERDLVCVTGRFQPVHRQHVELMLKARGIGQHLVVAITNPHANTRAAVPQSSHRHLATANPFTYFERLGMVEAALVAEGVPRGDFTVVPFPLHQGDAWHEYVPAHALHVVRRYTEWEGEKARMLAAGGYDVLELAGNADGCLSSSDIRRAIAEGDRWQEAVPGAVVPLVEQASARAGLRISR